MSRTDTRRPRRQVTVWQPLQDDHYQIQLEQIGHHAWRLTEHDGIEVRRVDDYTDPDEAQKAYLEAQGAYLGVLAGFTLQPLPTKPSEIVVIDADDE